MEVRKMRWNEIFRRIIKGITHAIVFILNSLIKKIIKKERKVKKMREKKKEEKRHRRGFRTAGLIIFILLFLDGLWRISSGYNWSWALIVVCAGIILGGVRIVQQQERFIIEFWGKFYTILNPGIRWIFPFLMKTRAIVSVWEQSIDLFPEKPSIDFSGGGTAELVDPKVWLKIEDPYKAIYNVANWREAVKEKVENLFRNYLSNQRVEEIIDQHTLHDWWALVKEEIVKGETPGPDPEEEILKDWGIRITRITVTDFKWSEEVIRARREVFEAQRKIDQEENLAKAAVYVAQKKAQESGGLHGEIKRLLQDKYGYSSDEATKVASEYVKYFKGAETGRLIDWRTSGEGGIYEMIVKGIMAIEKAKELVGKEKGKREK